MDLNQLVVKQKYLDDVVIKNYNNNHSDKLGFYLDHKDFITHRLLGLVVELAEALRIKRHVLKSDIRDVHTVLGPRPRPPAAGFGPGRRPPGPAPGRPSPPRRPVRSPIALGP